MHWGSANHRNWGRMVDTRSRRLRSRAGEVWSTAVGWGTMAVMCLGGTVVWGGRDCCTLTGLSQLREDLIQCSLHRAELSLELFDSSGAISEHSSDPLRNTIGQPKRSLTGSNLCLRLS